MTAAQVKSRTGVTWIDEQHGILRFEYAAGAECSLADAKENVEVQVGLCGGGKTLPILVDIAQAKSIDQAARNYYAESKAFPALALVGGAPVARVIGNIFLAVYGKGGMPTRLFGSEREAIAWLQGFLD